MINNASITKVNILLVDDKEKNLDAFEQVLDDPDYSLIKAQSGSEALKHLMEKNFALVLLDVRMPGIDGFEVAKLIRQREKTKNVPIIFVTADYSSMENISRGYKLDAVDYIIKPYDPAILKTKVSVFAELNRKEQLLCMSEQHLEHLTTKLSLTNAELVRGARIKDEFLANMSHELRTPLTSILGMSEALYEQIYGPLNEKQINSLIRIEESGKHLLSLINDILDLSKIEAEKMDMEIKHVEIETLCSSCVNMIKQIALKKNIKITVNIDSRLKYISTDARRLKQILVNLLSNAVKFTPVNKEIGLETICHKNRGSVDFIVWDKGIGISGQDMKRLFKPFVQLDSGLSRSYEGSGLGLVLVSRLTEKLGGSLSLKSEPGKGSRFSVSLAWESINKEEFHTDNSELSVSNDDLVHISAFTQTILLAEDNISNIETMFPYLQNKGYKVITACDGEEAVKLAKEKDPDLILMDIQMPNMDGIEAIQKIRKYELEHKNENNKPAMPIIALTALAMSGDREKCLEAGADEYIAKPVSMKGLIGIIYKLISEIPSSKN
ncbi:response regulator [Desulfobacterales bacterium HSG17]|nr:response regulator [Desulfobacterales bacterium HSG17]